MGKKDKELQESIDRGDFGKPLQYDANFLGPRAKRSCTDIICLLIFICFLVAWIVVGAIAFKLGDPWRMTAKVDSYGRRCGIDAGVEDKNYLFYFDITKCSSTTGLCDTPLVCVPQCPGEVYVGIQDGTNNLTRGIAGAVCRRDISIQQYTDLAEAIKQEICAAWYIPTRSVGQHCVSVRSSDVEDKTIKEALEYVGIDMQDIKNGMQAVQTISQSRKIGETILNDMKIIWPLLLGALGIAMILSMIFIVIMRWFAWIIVWFSLLGVLAVLGYCCYAAWVKYEEAVEADRQFDSVDSIFALKATWLIFFILSCVLLLVVLIIIIFLRNRIRIAIALISEGSRAVGSIKSTLFFPLIPWLIQIGIIAWTVAIWVYLTSSGLPIYSVKGLDNINCNCQSFSNGDSCEPEDFNEKCKSAIKECGNVACAFRKYESRSYTDYLHAFNIIGLFWVLCFVSAFSDMALAGTFSTWYWTFNKSDVPFFTLTYSVGRTMRYHLGTLAFGSLILAICRLIRVTLEYIKTKLGTFDNCFVKGVLCCLSCFFWCLEKFIKFINRNAYIMCSIHGKNFCRSARKAFNLLMRNILRVFVLDKVTDFLFFLGKLLITGAMVALAYYVFSKDLTVEDYEVPEVSYYLLPVILVGVATYFVTSIFFSVYAMAVDTLFLCFLEDLERNDGSTEKPYYMSKKLMKILGKKNKKYKERVE